MFLRENLRFSKDLSVYMCLQAMYAQYLYKYVCLTYCLYENLCFLCMSKYIYIYDMFSYLPCICMYVYTCYVLMFSLCIYKYISIHNLFLCFPYICIYMYDMLSCVCIYIYVYVICSFVCCDVLYYQCDSTNTFSLLLYQILFLVCESRPGSLSYRFRYTVTHCVSVSFQDQN